MLPGDLCDDMIQEIQEYHMPPKCPHSGLYTTSDLYTYGGWCYETLKRFDTFGHYLEGLLQTKQWPELAQKAYEYTDPYHLFVLGLRFGLQSWVEDAIRRGVVVQPPIRMARTPKGISTFAQQMKRHASGTHRISHSIPLWYQQTYCGRRMPKRP